MLSILYLSFIFLTLIYECFSSTSSKFEPVPISYLPSELSPVLPEGLINYHLGLRDKYASILNSALNEYPESSFSDISTWSSFEAWNISQFSTSSPLATNDTLKNAAAGLFLHDIYFTGMEPRGADPPTLSPYAVLLSSILHTSHPSYPSWDAVVKAITTAANTPLTKARTDSELPTWVVLAVTQTRAQVLALRSPSDPIRLEGAPAVPIVALDLAPHAYGGDWSDEEWARHTGTKQRPTRAEYVEEWAALVSQGMAEQRFAQFLQLTGAHKRIEFREMREDEVPVEVLQKMASSQTEADNDEL